MTATPRKATPTMPGRRWLPALLWLHVVFAALAAVGLWAMFTTEATLPPGHIAHATAMLVAWLLLLPAGVLVARFFKVTPDQDFPAELDNKTWWNWHRGLQYAAALAMSAAVAVLVFENGCSIDSLHAKIGLAAVALVWLQIAGGLLRGSKGGPVADDGRPNPAAAWRGDHYDMTQRRRLFEAVHKSGGWLALVLGVDALWLGIDLVGGPVWLTTILTLTVLGWLVISVALARSFPRAQTYQAIWGDDPRHPGNGAATDRPPPPPAA